MLTRFNVKRNNYRPRIPCYAGHDNVAQTWHSSYDCPEPKIVDTPTHSTTNTVSLYLASLRISASLISVLSSKPHMVKA